MNRRNCLQALALTATTALATKAADKNPIILIVNLEVDPAKEKTMVANYHKTFKPMISKQPGFVKVDLMKLEGAKVGTAPANWNYALLISFESEKQRVEWVARDEHQSVWPTIENQLKGKKFDAILYQTV